MESSLLLKVEYAPSGRAGCRGCKDKIAKEELRVGIVTNLAHYHAEKWYHMKCLDKVPPSLRNLAPTDVEGYININSEGKKQVAKLIETISQAPSRSTKKKQSEKKPKKTNSKDDVDEDEESDNERERERPGYYPEEKWKLFLKHQQELSGKTAAQLKQMLKLNNQTQTGTKDELVERVADAKTLGAIPKCPHCGGGRPRWDINKGIYKCPGYMEDTEFIHCKKRIDYEDLEREEWKEL